MSEDLSNPPFKIGDLITLDKDKCSDYLYASGAYPPGFVVEITKVYF